MVLLQNRKVRQIGSNLVLTCSSRPYYENEYLHLMFLRINNDVIGSGKWPNHASCLTLLLNVSWRDQTVRASDDRLIFSSITRCYDKRVTVFAVAIVVGDSVKYQTFVYGSFVWEIHMRYNNKYLVIFDTSRFSITFLSFAKSGKPISTVFLPFLDQ